MKFEEFSLSLEKSQPPSCLSAPLEALWWEGRGDWAKAHAIAQDIATVWGSRIHAYLHRKEGDLANADYWYSRARRERPQLSLKEEWREMVQELLADQD